MLTSSIAPKAPYKIDFLAKSCSLAERCLFGEIPALQIFQR
jgi:hypothetical protein